MKAECYFSVDIESSGPIPGKYSMLSLGACLVGRPEEGFYAELKPISKEFVPEALKVSGFSLDRLAKEGQTPEAAIRIRISPSRGGSSSTSSTTSGSLNA